MAVSFLNQEVQFAAIADKQKFEKELSEVLHKALNTSDAPCKEKHVRSTIIATWREKGAASTWKLLKTFPLQTNSNVCWKTCYLVHKFLREGHTQNIKTSAGPARFVNDLAKHWSHLGDPYSKMITSYLKLVWTKIAFHVKNPDIPKNLRFIDTPFTIPTDIDYVFHFNVEVFDYQSAILHVYAAIVAGIDLARPPSAGQLQMKVTPFVLCIQESASLYDLAFQLMKALHTSLPADTLQGHRDRFNRQYHALRKYFMEAKKISYVKKLVEVPILPPNPPNFLIGKYMEDIHLSRQVVLAGEEPNFEDTSFLSMGTAAPEASPSHSLSSVPELSPAPDQRTNGAAKPGTEQTDQFDAIFGTNTFDQFFVPEEPKQDEKDLLIEQLMREIVELKSRIAELEGQLRTSFDLIQSLKVKLEQKETELTDYKEIAEQACSENVKFKEALEASQTNKEGAEAHATARAKEAEQKFTRLRDVYQKLRGDHIQLLRQNGECKKQLAAVEKSINDDKDERKNLERKITSLTMQLEEAKELASEETAQISLMRDQLKHKEMESVKLQESRAVLEEQLVKAEETGSHTLLVQAIQESESIISRVKEEIQSPIMDGLTCTPAHLLSRTTASLDVIDNLTTAISLYSNDPSTLGGALSSLSRLSHSMSEVMVQGAATANMACAEDGQKLTHSSCTVGDEALKLLHILKQEKLSSGQIFASGNSLQKAIKSLTRQAEELIPDSPAQEEEEEPLGDAVEQEMANTSRAINEAAKRIEEMLRKSRTEQSGVNLEVNERILDSCTELMRAIQTLIQRSKEMQKEIIAEGMGTMLEPKEFYKKHSRWSEGLISAAKQVGFGASLLVESADKVVSGKGKFEELIVTSKDIAASTAQLVAASKVKARPRSEKLKSLKVSSKLVSEATGQVVASAQTGSEMKSDASTMDYSKMTLNQAKRLEMESQVRALELEKELQMERTRLTELRKIHYHLAGAAEGWDDEES